MHILQVISGREVNGAVTYVRFLARQLLRSGHAVTVLHRRDSWIGDHPVPGARYVESELQRTPRELRRVAGLIQQNGIDLVHTHMSRAHFFGVLLRPLVKRPVVATAHSCRFQLHWPFNDFVIANSGSTLEYQRRFNLVKSARSRTVYCFTDLQRFHQTTTEPASDVRRQLGLTDGNLLLGVVGQVGRRKGQKILFECLPDLFARFPGMHLAVVGEFERDWPYVRRLRAWQRRNRLFRRIHWLGRRRNVEDYMSAMDICAIPSLREPLGLVALEALASGTPVVASNVGGLPEIVTHEQTGLLVPPNQPLLLLDAISELAANAPRRTEMGQRGRELVCRRFQPEQLTAQVIGVYQQLLAACDTTVRRPVDCKRTAA